MAEKKRKSVESSDSTKHKMKYNKKPTRQNKKLHSSEKKKRKGPRLPNSLRKELDLLNTNSLNGSDEDIGSDDVTDLYEYDEPLPQEESRKNRRFDPVDNYEYELPKNFEDENVLSDDEDDSNDIETSRAGKSSNCIGDDDDDNDNSDERHLRMLQGITGMPSEAFDGKKKKKNVVISEAYPESEFNPSSDVLHGNGQISIEDLLEPLQGKSGYSKLKKRMHEMQKKSTSVLAPLPKVEREKLERKVVYEKSKKDITKWEPRVKLNREAPSLYFDEDTDLGYSTVGAIASGFEPRTAFEKKMASLVSDDKVLEAHKEDGSRLLELNKISVEDYLEERNHTAKMRSLLFRHEMKSKRIKKIKSKTYHRLLKKDRLKAASADMLMDPEAVKEEARKQEFRRAEERMTLKHKNSSKWAKRILKRGLDAQDEGTRAAISEQLQQHALLTRKMKSMNDSSSSGDDSSDDDEENSENAAGSDQDEMSKLLAKAKEKTRQVLEEDDEVPDSGVLSLPFMQRGMKKRKEEAIQEATAALQEYESSLKELEGTSGEENHKGGTTGGRRVFGPVTSKIPVPRKKMKTDNYYGNSDSEDESEAEESLDVRNGSSTDVKDFKTDSLTLHPDPEIHQNSMFKSMDDIARDPGPKTSCDVAMIVSGTWKKMNKDANVEKSIKIVKAPSDNQGLEETAKDVGEDSDTDSEGQMVDWILSSGPKASYQLPSQEELIRLAFAGDDVEEDFEKDKEEILNVENPVPEKPNLIPGWGQWTNVQRKKGVPSWMLDEHEHAAKKREEALKKRKDAHLKHVIISEKLDKKAEKLHTKTLPYPFTSKEVFEQSIRVPVGPEFNPATAVGALTQPEVRKKSGIIIKPIKFEEVNTHEKTEERKQNVRKHKSSNKNKGKGDKRSRTRPVVVKS